jgi:hypothetical protein
MARLNKGSLFNALQGTIGKEIVFKRYADKTVVSKYPDMSKVKTTKRQRAQRDLLKEANAYASTVLRDVELRKKFEKKLKAGESVFHKAKKEFFERQKKEINSSGK